MRPDTLDAPADDELRPVPGSAGLEMLFDHPVVLTIAGELHEGTIQVFQIRPDAKPGIRLAGEVSRDFTTAVFVREGKRLIESMTIRAGDKILVISYGFPVDDPQPYQVITTPFSVN